ncbi:unnamed protein product [Linum trigynum]|uniref:Phytocyanin domain-containing protein n=1 Tax=Linum trigynum TaxID=586398 RepID=A0AAV2DW88_9ROSI
MARLSGLGGSCSPVAAAAAIFILLVNTAAAQTVHVVGDNMGWTVPQGGAQAYATWATGKTFAVGDILTFNFDTNNHDVLQVQRSSFDACTSSDAVGSVIMTGPANVTLDTAGDHYYICTISRHCAAGQKLAITVASTPGGPTTNPPSTPTNMIPPPAAGGAPDEACAPAPEAAGPTTMMSPPPPPSSSSRAFLSVLTVAAAAAPLLFFVLV